jgi:hypothetical protein
MAKIDNNNTNNKRNSNKMPIGTMPKDKLTRFKLKGNIDNPGDYKVRTMADVKIVARNARALHTYRMYVHGCVEPRLPSSLRRTIHYFLTPMNRGDSDNSKDRKAATFEVETENNNTINETNS